MASFRRTLSPVQRQGASLNGETVSVGSPLSKSSSCTQDYQSTSGGGGTLSSSLIGFADPQAFLFGVYSPRSSSRFLERSKPKVQVWRKALMYFFLCFSVGVFFGLTPFASMEFSMVSMAKHQAFSFDLASSVRNFQENGVETRDRIRVSDIKAIEINVSLESPMRDQEAGKNSTGVLVNNQKISKEDSILLVPRKLLMIVTPTYARPFQAYYLNRLGQMLRLVEPPILWIVIEMNSQSGETAEILRKTGVMYRHLVCNKNLTSAEDRSIHQRNVAIAHIGTHRLDGIVYFADDSNIYSVDLFEQMRRIRRFGTWKVAKLTGRGKEAIVEGPVCNGTHVIGWHTNQPWRRFRRFHTEMSGFAFNSTALWDPKRWHRPTIEPIRQVDYVQDDFKVSAFVEQIVEDESQMEGLPQDCSHIMVWQLDIESSIPFYPNKWLLKNNGDTNISPLFRNISVHMNQIGQAKEG